MKRIYVSIIVLLVCLALTAAAHATPQASDWYRAELIGANKESFFYYLTHKELPGSYYYSYTHYRLIQRNKETGKIEGNIHLKSTKNISDEHEKDGVVTFTYRREHIFISKTNPMEVIRDSDVSALFPDVDAPLNLKFDRKGMYVIRGKKRRDLLPREYLDRFMKGYDKWVDWEQGVKVLQACWDRDYYYYILEFGQGGDMDYFQVILPVSIRIINSLGE